MTYKDGKNKAVYKLVGIYFSVVIVVLALTAVYLINRVRPGIPVEVLERQAALLTREIALGFTIAGGIIIILTGLVIFRFSRSVREVSAAAKRIAHGNFSERILISPQSIFGELTEALRYISEQVKMRIDEVTLGKSRLEAVFLGMFEGVVVVNRSADIVLMNQTLKDLLGIQEDPAGKKSLAVIRNIKVQDVIQKTLTLPAQALSSEIFFLFPEEKTLLVHATPVVRDNELEGGILVFHDITELRRLERMRQEFVANVSHELRTPLASIKGYAETLLEGAWKDKENAQDFLRIICADADRLARLIEDILHLSRIEAGTLKVHTKPCSITALIDRVVSGLSKQIVEKQLKVENTISPQSPDVLADEDRMAQVVLNLLDNAIKYTPAGGKITVAARAKDKYLQVDISDSGIGISEKDLPRVFERFYRVDKARSRELGGTGLGLAIVKHIVQAHHGEVSVTSSPGQGSTFSFTIPMA